MNHRDVIIAISRLILPPSTRLARKSLFSRAPPRISSPFFRFFARRDVYISAEKTRICSYALKPCSRPRPLDGVLRLSTCFFVSRPQPSGLGAQIICFVLIVSTVSLRIAPRPRPVGFCPCCISRKAVGTLHLYEDPGRAPVVHIVPVHIALRVPVHIFFGFPLLVLRRHSAFPSTRETAHCCVRFIQNLPHLAVSTHCFIFLSVSFSLALGLRYVTKPRLALSKTFTFMRCPVVTFTGGVSSRAASPRSSCPLSRSSFAGNRARRNLLHTTRSQHHICSFQFSLIPRRNLP